jgi:adenylate cyclase
MLAANKTDFMPEVKKIANIDDLSKIPQDLAPYGPDLFGLKPGEALIFPASGELALCRSDWPPAVVNLPGGNQNTHTLHREAVYFSAQSLVALLGKGNNAGFIVNKNGQALMGGEKRSPSFIKDAFTPFVRDMIATGESNRQTLYFGADGKRYFGAIESLSGFGASAVTIIPYDTVFAGIRAVIERNILISLGTLAFASLIILIYSLSMSLPLKALTKAVHRIEKGRYDLHLKDRRRDEIGDLTRSFIGMRNGLQNFEHFTNRAVLAQARRGALTRTGRSRNVTVAFFFIRDFSETWKNVEASEVVSFVNQFLARMVPAITSTGGEVDKFLTQGGVVIMALWGVLEDKPPAASALACIQSALRMRSALKAFNAERKGRLVKIGAGINSGEVIAGQMGGEERMEYTVIGDTVNMAARIEGPNDLFDTDILITENTWRLVSDRVLTKEMPGLEIKGKTEPMRVFAVLRFKNQKGPSTLAEVRAGWRGNY